MRGEAEEVQRGWELNAAVASPTDVIAPDGIYILFNFKASYFYVYTSLILLDGGHIQFRDEFLYYYIMIK